MKTRLFNNLWLKILSVFAAMLLWLVVVNINDAVTSKPFRNIKVNTINMEALTSQGQTVRVDEDTDTVDIVVYARRTVLDKLRASDFVATADMQKDLRYGGMVKIEVSYTGNHVIDRIEQNRENVLVSIEEAVTEQFKVTVETDGSPSAGLVVGSKIPEQTLVEITGPASVVERIKYVEARVNISGITGTATRTCRLKLLNGDKDPIDGTYLDYYGKDTEFEVTITTLNTKRVGISFDISQAAPEGYGIAGITYKPETVTIAGQRSQLGSIYNLNIPPEALNPEGLTGKVEQTVDISQYLDSGLLIPEADEREIAVTMDIVPHATTAYIILPEQIQYDGLPEGYELDLSGSAPVEIPVSGLEANLSTFTAEGITAGVDMSQIRRAGTYTLPVLVTLPDGLYCTSEPQITVEVKRAR